MVFEVLWIPPAFRMMDVLLQKSTLIPPSLETARMISLFEDGMSVTSFQNH